MVRIKIGAEVMRNNIRARVRFDYKGWKKVSRFFFGNKSSDKIATEIRQQQAIQLRNVPLHNISIEEINTDIPLYTIYQEQTDEVLAYAPMELIISASNIEDIMCFILREELRRVEILEPDQICITRGDMERCFVRINERVRDLSEDIYNKASDR